VITLVFAAGAAYESFAPRPWVQTQIKEHEERTEQARKDDMKLIRESLNRIEERQWQQQPSQKRP